MNISYSISTINYDGYDYDTIFSSLQNLGVKQTELALIVGSISNLNEEDLTKEYVENLLCKMQKHNITCTSLACHIQTLDINNANEMFCKRIKLLFELS